MSRRLRFSLILDPRATRFNVPFSLVSSTMWPNETRILGTRMVSSTQALIKQADLRRGSQVLTISPFVRIWWSKKELVNNTLLRMRRSLCAYHFYAVYSKPLIRLEIAGSLQETLWRRKKYTFMFCLLLLAVVYLRLLLFQPFNWLLFEKYCY